MFYLPHQAKIGGEKMADYRETEVAKQLHIERKVLFKIKQAGLISPSRTEQHGTMEYCFYDDNAITTLWLIVRYREFGYSYDDIGKRLNGPAGSRNQMLHDLLTRLDHMTKLARIIYETGLLPPDFMKMKDIMDAEYFKQLDDPKVIKRGERMIEKILKDSDYNNSCSNIKKLYGEGYSKSSPEIQQAVAETERAIEKYTSKESARNVLRVLGDLFNGDGNIQETTELGADWIKEIGAAYQYYCKEKEIL
jgi:DNA-binding transcriptional MerR regulator